MCNFNRNAGIITSEKFESLYFIFKGALGIFSTDDYEEQKSNCKRIIFSVDSNTKLILSKTKPNSYSLFISSDDSCLIESLLGYLDEFIEENGFPITFSLSEPIYD